MEYNRRHTSTKSKRNTTGTQKEEVQTTHPHLNQQQPSKKKHKNHRYQKPNPPITNLSNHHLSKDEINLLSKGLNFIPTPRRDHPAKMLQDILLFDRTIRLKYHFMDTGDQPQISQQPNHNQILQPSSGWTPSSGQDPFLDTYRHSIINAYLKELEYPTTSRRKKNLPQKQVQAMRDLHNNNNIIIKPADKGGSIVIMNKADYIQEAHRQLFNPEHYKPLTSDPTTIYNKYIHHHIDQAWRLGIITDTTKESLQTKNPRTSTFYMLPKIHKPGNPGRPIVNSIGSITEKISAFVDSHLKQFTPRIPSYIKDTTHFINEKYSPRP